jgi:hypothetical protein
MALERKENGQFVVRTMADAKEAMRLRDELLDEIRKSGIEEMQTDCTEMSRALGAFMVAGGIDEIADKKTNRRAVLVQRFNRKWIATRKELKSEGVDGKALQDLVDKEVFMKITKRVVDPIALDEAMRDGLVDESEIADAYVETPQKPFTQVYDLKVPDDEED